MYKKNNLQTQTILSFFLLAVKKGWKKLKGDTALRFIIRLLAAFLLLFTLSNMLRCVLLMPSPLSVFGLLMWGILYAAALLAILAFAGNFLTGQKYSNDFIRIGFVNSAGEPPLLLTQKVLENGMHSMTFWGKGFPLDKWEEHRPFIETAFNITVFGISPSNEDNRCISMDYRPGCGWIPECVKWDARFLRQEDFVLALGQTFAGLQAVVDLTKTPHLLIAGATGMGKSVLLKSLACQILAKGADLVIADWKCGLDYPASLRTACRFVDTEAALQQVLDKLWQETTRRTELMRDAGCALVSEYNITAMDPLRRIVLLIDEASLLFDVSHRPKAEKDAANRILGVVVDMARKCRACGIHIIVATQRPTSESLPGVLKANLDGRICAHTADNQGSIAALDDGSAAKLPAVPGRFILRTGAAPDIIFQAYLMEDESLLP
ncbi:MAG: FtsK/SpoIIIE domain-containing protein [Muribaculaceae bacterium]|nr:FtsK/SpoIIIE domain-containing protein [Muribaculaceae bacterium]